jgi:hypothetical protein
METPKVKYEGQPTIIGGREFIVPSLSVKQTRDLWPIIDGWGGPASSPDKIPERYEGGVKIIYAALSRNYPELTLEELEDALSHNQFVSVLSVVLRESGLVPSGIKPAAEPTVP